MNDNVMILGNVKFEAFNLTEPGPLLIVITCLGCGKEFERVSYTISEHQDERDAQIEQASIRAVNSAARYNRHVCYNN